ncbi:MAG: amino acid ABC transporter substrate-binding protein [Gammaproteobacteria bacterium]|nr:MAG: amino acid ABC transporter substrate-binding protein [Gammaproteobacteria bacterium]
MNISKGKPTPIRALLAAALAMLATVLSHGTLGADPIRIGMTASLTGQYAAPGDNMLKGIRMWADDVNGRGALLGRPVEIVYYDDKSDPATSARLYERLISEDKVDLLVGPYASDLTLEASSVAERHDFPMVSGSAAASAIWARGYKNIFQVDAPAEKFMDGLMESASNAGLSRIAIAYAGSEFPRAVATGVRAKAAELNMSLVFDREYPDGTTDFTGVVRDMKATSPDLVIGGTYLNDSIAFVQEAKRQQFSPKAFAFTVGPALIEFGDRLGPDAEGILGVVSWMRGGSVPMAYDFSFRYKRKYGRNAGVHAAYGYAAGQVLEAGVRLAGSLDRDAIRQQLREMRFRSILGNYKVDETGKQLAKSTYVMQWQDGYRLLVLPKAIRDAEVIYPLKPWSER